MDLTLLITSCCRMIKLLIIFRSQASARILHLYFQLRRFCLMFLIEMASTINQRWTRSKNSHFADICDKTGGGFDSHMFRTNMMNIYCCRIWERFSSSQSPANGHSSNLLSVSILTRRAWQNGRIKLSIRHSLSGDRRVKGARRRESRSWCRAIKYNCWFILPTVRWFLLPRGGGLTDEREGDETFGFRFIRAKMNKSHK